MRYALKCIHRQSLEGSDKPDSYGCESTVLQEIDHPFIVRLVRTFATKSWAYSVRFNDTGNGGV